MIAKPAGSPVGCAHSRCSVGSAPRIFPASKGVRTLRNRANEAGDTWGGVARFSVLSSSCAPPCMLWPPVSMLRCGVCRAPGMVCSEPPCWRTGAPQPCRPFVARPFARLPFRWLAAGCAVRVAWCAANPRIGGPRRRSSARSFAARPLPAAVSMLRCGVCRAPGMVCSKPPDWRAMAPQPCPSQPHPSPGASTERPGSWCAEPQARLL
ncbi:hypothetical protein J2790_000250 [Paenarthrobacter nicotinovorans]|nr:hypothetical protein [Paenarthrobacter nicotinovorans]